MCLLFSPKVDSKPVFTWIYDLLSRSESKCENDCSYGPPSEISPKLFKNRGQLDNIYKIDSGFEIDILMKTAELSEYVYHSKDHDFAFAQAMYLQPDIITPFKRRSDDYHQSGVIAKIKYSDNYNEDICLIALKGSSGYKDWMGNLNLAEFDFGFESFVINDFYRPFYQKSILINELIFQETKSCKHYIFTGHSSGAATATVSAILLQERLRQRSSCDVNVVGFASPRPGNSNLINRAKNLDFVFLIENKGDIVPIENLNNIFDSI